MFFGSDHLERAASGAKFGVLMACLFVAYVLLLYLFRGSAPFETVGVSIAGLVIAYVATGLAAGAVAGLLWPLTRRRLGATVVGALCGFLVYSGVGILVYGPVWTWDAPAWIISLILGLLIGGGVANVWYRSPPQRVPAPEPSALRTVHAEKYPPPEA